MNISLTNGLFILIIFQLLFLCFFLFSQKRGRKTSNRLLGSFFLAICLNLLDVFLLNTGLYFTYPFLAGFGSCMLLVLGPLLYLYTQSVVYKNFSITLKSLIHFVPFAILFSATEFFYLIQAPPVQELVLRRLAEHHLPAAFSLVSALIFAQFLLYMIFSFRLISLYKMATSQLFSNTKYTNVSWLYSIISFFTVIMVTTTLNVLLSQTSFAKYYLAAFNIIILAVLVFVIRVLMKALRDPSFFSFTDRDLSGKIFSLYKNNEAENDEMEKTVQNLLLHMKANKPFLEPELTLDQLASQLALKPRYLSQIINEQLQQNFFDFINRYRVDEAAKLLTHPDDKKITVLEVLYKVGFNSKSSFNTLFKKYTGLTPTEFRQKKNR